MAKKEARSNLLDELASLEGRVNDELADPENHSVGVRDALLQFRSAILLLNSARHNDSSMERA